jgi:hypothetical protein
MAMYGISEKTNAFCLQCGEESDGVVFCPAKYDGEFVILDKGKCQFLCDKHFADFLRSENHRVILGDEKWLKMSKP